MRNRSLFPLCLTLALVAGPALAQEVEEPRTGQRFATTDDGLSLAGVGVRTKLFIKVYAAGFYVDAEQARTHLERFRGVSAEELAGREDFYTRLVKANIAKKMVMRFVYNAGAKKVRGAFEDGLKTNLPEGTSPAAEEFLGLFEGDIGGKGSVLTVRTEPGGRILVHSDGAELGTLEDVELTEALWKIWFGPKPAIPGLKPQLVTRMPEVLQ